MYMLIGGSGGPNYGDELMVKGWVEYLQGLSCENLRVEVNVRKNAEEFHQKEEVKFSSDLRKVAKAYDKLTFWDQVIRGFNFFVRNGEKNHGDIDFEFLNKLKVVHLHGGGYLNKNAPVNGFMLGFCAAIKCKKKDVKLIATGIGMMPIDFPEGHKGKAVKDVFSQFDGFEVRDHESFLFLSKLTDFKNENIIMGVDDSFIIEKENVIGQDRYKKSSSLYLSFARYNLSLFSKEYWDGLRRLAAKFDDVVFWECFPWKDKEVFSHLKDKVPEVRAVSAKDFVYGRELVSHHDFLITNRFHPHLVSARIGMNGVYYVSNEYYDVKHNSVVAVGSHFQKGEFTRCSITPSSLGKGKLLSYNDAILNKQKSAIYEYMMNK